LDNYSSQNYHTLKTNNFAIRFLYEHIYNKEFDKIDIGKEKTGIKDILTELDWKLIVKTMEDNNINPNVQLMIKMMYETGLRVNELVNIKHKNFFTENNYA
jgi:site-specific recombinase XerD